MLDRKMRKKICALFAQLGNQIEVARRLGVGRRTVFTVVKELRLFLPANDAQARSAHERSAHERSQQR